MKKFALIAAVAAIVAAPAFAQSARFGAVEHFNMFADTVSERLVLNDVGTPASATGALLTAIDVFNSSQDTVTELSGRNGVTTFSSTPAHGTDIFIRLNAAAQEDE